jgi:hypothetical protein
MMNRKLSKSISSPKPLFPFHVFPVHPALLFSSKTTPTKNRTWTFDLQFVGAKKIKQEDKKDMINRNFSKGFLPVFSAHPTPLFSCFYYAA